MPWLFARTVLKYVSGIYLDLNAGYFFFFFKQASLVTQAIKNLPATQEIWVWSLGQEDALEKGMTTHSSIPAWRIPRAEEPGGLQSTGWQRVGKDWATFMFFKNGMTPRS